MNLKPNHRFLRIQLSESDHRELKCLCAMAGQTQTEFFQQMFDEYKKLQQNKGN
jgi:hypothetical protein